MQLDVDVDGYGQGQELVVLDDARRFVGPDLRHVDDLECKFTSLGWACVGDWCDIEWKLKSALPVCHLSDCR